jgi:hypothetical protein
MYGFITELLEKRLKQNNNFVNIENQEHTEVYTSLYNMRNFTNFIWFICFITGIFLLFRCNRGEQMKTLEYLGHFIILLCCAPCYVAFILATSWDKCFSLTT